MKKIILVFWILVSSCAVHAHDEAFECHYTDPRVLIYFEKELYRRSVGNIGMGATVVGTLRASFGKPGATADNENPNYGVGVSVTNRLDALFNFESLEIGRADLKFGNYGSTFREVTVQHKSTSPVNHLPSFSYTSNYVDLRLLGMSIGAQEAETTAPGSPSGAANRSFGVTAVPAFNRGITFPPIPVGPIVITVTAGVNGLVGTQAAAQPVFDPMSIASGDARFQASLLPRAEVGGYLDAAVTLFEIIRGGAGGSLLLASANAGPAADVFVQKGRVNLRATGSATFLSGRIYAFVDHRWFSIFRGMYWRRLLALDLYRFPGYSHSTSGMIDGLVMLVNKSDSGEIIDVPVAGQVAATGGVIQQGGNHTCYDCIEDGNGQVIENQSDFYYYNSLIGGSGGGGGGGGG